MTVSANLHNARERGAAESEVFDGRRAEQTTFVRFSSVVDKLCLVIIYIFIYIGGFLGIYELFRFRLHVRALRQATLRRQLGDTRPDQLCIKDSARCSAA